MLNTNLKISIVDAYIVMETCVDAGVAEQNLQIYCPLCQRFTGKHYKSILTFQTVLNVYIVIMR